MMRPYQWRCVDLMDAAERNMSDNLRMMYVFRLHQIQRTPDYMFMPAMAQRAMNDARLAARMIWC